MRAAAIVRKLLPARLLRYGRVARRTAHTWRRNLDRTLDRRVLSRDEFAEHLRRLGVVPGATVYIHSSMDALRRRLPDLAPLAVVDLLKELVGEEGTLLMPTFPFRGLQYDYVQRQRVFDVRRMPSQVGLLTEIFRRSEGVRRSLHPTHPIAAWGQHSEELLAAHHLGTAFGESSPVYRMQRHDGLVVGLGVTPERCFTLYHIAEELHPSTRAAQYHPGSFAMTILHEGQEIPYRVTPLRRDRIRRYERAGRILRREGILRCYSVEGLRLSAAPVRRFLERAQELIDANRFYAMLARTRR